MDDAAPRRIAFQGERGAYGDEAARALFGPAVVVVPCPSFRAVLEAVAEGRVDGGVVPVESALAGPVAEVVDLLLEFTPRLSGELRLRVRHCLLAPPGRSLASLTRALSHPQALAQCSGWLRKHHLQPVPEVNTAVAARRVGEEAPAGTAAIASRAAADLYGLAVLAEGIEDSPDNATRFLAVGPALPPHLGSRWKTSVVLTLNDGPGALAGVLGAFAARGVNVARLESRPGGVRAWDYRWCLDVDGAQDAPPVRIALDEARSQCTSLQVLGSYALSD
ncbi:ACT domain-containing protein [Corallococcus sp. BB11-1]|uniref:prephenate dehydratase n=1 Tax=Corallococcus sp. BB11-1 TaxID=2996783 RepID=UPI0022705811|nr:prephenate dehydratase domain-containing protein [Corallococcus sp. BB11-1]MCY1032610.1 ACT domain-containing protein [Corallococcus sp. BB11-1]